MSRLSDSLRRSFFDRSAEDVAADLLGSLLVSEIEGVCCVGRIVETEAYPGPHDPASHAAARIGRTARNEPMFGPPGSVYLHLNYGVHWCLNAVVEREGYPAAVLIRALEPVEGIEVMRQRRGGRSDRDLCSGPGKLTQALRIGPELQGHVLDAPPLYIVGGEELDPEVVARSPRVGINRGADRPWRFFVRGSRYVSRSAGPSRA